jgi:hypothetical protein
MPHYNIVIETHRDRDPDRVRASVAEGPPFLHGYYTVVRGIDAKPAADSLKHWIVDDFPQHTFDFIHAEG